MAMTDRTRDAVCDIAAKLEAQGIRVETDLRNEKIGFKIREAQMQKIPYMLIVGDKEVENGVVAVRARKGGRSRHNDPSTLSNRKSMKRSLQKPSIDIINIDI